MTSTCVELTVRGCPPRIHGRLPRPAPRPRRRSRTTGPHQAGRQFLFALGMHLIHRRIENRGSVPDRSPGRPARGRLRTGPYLCRGLAALALSTWRSSRSANWMISAASIGSSKAPRASPGSGPAIGSGGPLRPGPGRHGTHQHRPRGLRDGVLRRGEGGRGRRPRCLRTRQLPRRSEADARSVPAARERQGRPAHSPTQEPKAANRRPLPNCSPTRWAPTRTLPATTPSSRQLNVYAARRPSCF